MYVGGGIPIPAGSTGGGLRPEPPSPPSTPSHTTSEIAELFGIARSTVYRAIQRAGVPPVATIDHEPEVR